MISGFGYKGGSLSSSQTGKAREFDLYPNGPTGFINRTLSSDKLALFTAVDLRDVNEQAAVSSWASRINNYLLTESTPSAQPVISSSANTLNERAVYFNSNDQLTIPQGGYDLSSYNKIFIAFKFCTEESSIALNGVFNYSSEPIASGTGSVRLYHNTPIAGIFCNVRDNVPNPNLESTINNAYSPNDYKTFLYKIDYTKTTDDEQIECYLDGEYDDVNRGEEYVMDPDSTFGNYALYLGKIISAAGTTQYYGEKMYIRSMLIAPNYYPSDDEVRKIYSAMNEIDREA